MTILYDSTTAGNRLTAVLAAINSQTFNAPSGTASNGSLVIGTSAFTNANGTTGVSSASTGVLVVVPLPAAGLSVSGRVLSLIASAVSATASGTGTAANAAVINNAGKIIGGSLTVATTGADVNLNATAISQNQTVTINSASITHP